MGSSAVERVHWAIVVRTYLNNFNYLRTNGLIFRFAGISCGIVYIYSLSFQSIDEEAYGGAWELMKEGFMTSFAGFLVTWIIFYSGLHFDSSLHLK